MPRPPAADYLHDLGVDWVYLSPLLTAEGIGSRLRRGRSVARSTRPEAARDGLRRGSPPRRATAGLGVLVDIVPNHMGVATPRENPLVVGRAGARPRLAVRRGVRHRLGRRRRARPACRCSATMATADAGCAGELTRRRAALLRPPFPLAPGTADDGADARAVHDRQHYELMNWRAGRRGAQLPPVLRASPRWPASASRCRGSSTRPTPRSSAGSTKGWWTDCASITRTGWPTRRATCDRLRRATGGAYVLVEKILEPGREQLPADWPRRHDGLRRAGARSTGCSSTRRASGRSTPRRRGCAAAAGRRTEPTDPRHQADDRRRRSCAAEVRRLVRALVPARRRTGPATPRMPSPSCSLLPGVPLRTCRPARSTRRGRGRGPARRPDLAEAIDVLVPAAAPTPAPELALRFQQTTGMVMAKGVEDTAFYRYTRLGSLTEVGGDPIVFALDRRRVPRGAWPAAGELAARDDHALHPRHQAQRGRPRPDLRARRDARTRWADAAARGCGARRRSADRRSTTCCGRRSSAPGRVSRERAARLRREGGPRSRRRAPAGSTRTPRSKRGCTPRGRGLRRSGGAPAARRLRRRIARRRLVQLAVRQAAQLTMPGRARRLPGHRALGPLAGGPGQPPAGRLRSARRRSPSWTPGRRAAAWTRRGGEAAGHRPGAAAAPGPARAVHRLRRR